MLIANTQILLLGENHVSMLYYSLIGCLSRAKTLVFSWSVLGFEPISSGDI
jgi:hypothetical protein